MYQITNVSALGWAPGGAVQISRSPLIGYAI